MYFERSELTGSRCSA